MKLVHCLALVALIFLVEATSINCVQNNSPHPTPAPAATPTGTPVPGGYMTTDQQYSIYNTAIQDPYVRERIVKTAWRNAQQVDNKIVTNTSYAPGKVRYMSVYERGPDFERTRVLPAAEIIPGNGSQAGVNLIAFVDPDQKRVAYIGFVPRPGVPPAPGVTYSSFDAGVDEYDATTDVHRYYNNVTVVNTGYTKGMSLSQDQKEIVQAIDEDGNQLMLLINDLLDLSRVESGKMLINLEKVSIYNIVELSIRPLMGTAESRGIHLSHDVSPELPPVYADRNKIKIVISNLVTNALKFTARDGHVTISAKPEGALMKVWVKDTGVGIPEEYQEKIFDRFTQVRTPGAGGTGLGLAITREFLKKNNGDIWVESKPGKGSTFIFTLPLYKG
jgi:two-component sensor histidine kinase